MITRGNLPALELRLVMFRAWRPLAVLQDLPTRSEAEVALSHLQPRLHKGDQRLVLADGQHGLHRANRVKLDVKMQGVP